MTPCDRCGCPLLLLETARAPYHERRRRCASCSGAPLAVPCRVPNCWGAVVRQQSLICDYCRVVRQRLANRASYQLHTESRLAQRRQRRQAEGEALRAAERARYAAKKGRPVRAYRRREGEA